MKIRKGFVSNSSSSSFICEVCGNVESGYDASYDDVDFAQCENGHVMCRDHIKPITAEKAKAILKKIKQDTKYVSEEFLEQEEADQIDELMSINLSYFTSGTMSDYGYDELPEELCPLCSLEALSDGDILTYILKENGSTREFVIKKAKAEFGSYDKFAEAMK